MSGIALRAGEPEQSEEALALSKLTIYQLHKHSHDPLENEHREEERPRLLAAKHWVVKEA